MNMVVTKKRFVMIGREFNVSADMAYAFIAQPSNLPKWALAFRDADEYSALLAFPDGNSLRVPMITKVSKEFGVIDWHISLPNGFLDIVRSRVYSVTDDRCIYELSFNERPVADAMMESAMEEQARMVEQEFDNLETVFSGMRDL
jgi:hypothetical protein